MDISPPKASLVASNLSDPSRATMMAKLLDGCLHPATELAIAAKIKPQTASFHLAKLLESGLVLVEKHGRHRYYKLANYEVAQILESILLLTPPSPIRSLNEQYEMKKIYFARTCYDHLAGYVGVATTNSLLQMEVLTEENHGLSLTKNGEDFLLDFGIPVQEIRKKRRQFCRKCLDWSEKRFHLAGALGNAFLERLFDLDWIRRYPNTRAVQITEEGTRKFAEVFSIHLLENRSKK